MHIPEQTCHRLRHLKHVDSGRNLLLLTGIGGRHWPEFASGKPEFRSKRASNSGANLPPDFYTIHSSRVHGVEKEKHETDVRFLEHVDLVLLSRLTRNYELASCEAN